MKFSASSKRRKKLNNLVIETKLFLFRFFILIKSQKKPIRIRLFSIPGNNWFRNFGRGMIEFCSRNTKWFLEILLNWQIFDSVGFCQLNEVGWISKTFGRRLDKSLVKRKLKSDEHFHYLKCFSLTGGIF